MESTKPHRYFLIIFVSALISLNAPIASIAQQDEELQEIIKGFEDQGPASSDEASIEDVLEGFEDVTEEPENDLDEEEILEGFEDEEQKLEEAEAKKEYLPSFLSLDGYFKLASSYGLHSHTAAGTDTNWHGLNKLRTELFLELDADLPDSWQARISAIGFYDWAYRLNGRDNYTDKVLRHYEDQLWLGDTWLQGSLTKSLDIKAGRQVVVWGKSDNIRITDVLNPLDLREPGLTDLQNLRLPVTMTKLDYYVKGLNISAMIIHEVRYNVNPVFGNDFFPAPEPLPGRENPGEGFDIENTQFALALHGIFHGWDASIYAADFYDPDPHLALTSLGPPPQFERKHARLKMVGGACNIARGNWLFKTEAAFFDGLEFFNVPDDEFSRVDGLVGLEYSGFADTTISLEIANRHLLDFDARLKEEPDFEKENRFISAIRLTKTYFNDTLTLTALAQTFGVTGQDGAFQRLTAEYDLTDAIEITGGMVFYKSGDLPRFTDVGKNDRIYLDVKYHF